MDNSTAKILPPTPEELEAAGRELFDELVKTEKQPLHAMKDIDTVFAGLDARFSAKVQSRNN